MMCEWPLLGATCSSSSFSCIPKEDGEEDATHRNDNIEKRRGNELITSNTCHTTLFIFLTLLVFQLALPYSFASELGLTFVALPQSRVIASRSRPLSLNCTAIDDFDGSNNISYRWKHNSIPIEVDDKRYQLEQDGAVLTIRRILASPKSKKRTDGKYMCTATNRMGHTLASKEISVQSTKTPKSLRIKSMSSIGKMGENIRLVCELNSNPESWYSWFFNDEPLHEKSHVYTLMNSSILHILNASKINEGRYSCVANNGIRSWNSNKFYLRIQAAEDDYKSIIFLNENRTSTVARRGEMVTIECLINLAYPNAIVTWRRMRNKHFHFSNNRRSTHHKSTNKYKRFRIIGESNLQIEGLEREDDDIYICNASYKLDEFDISHQTEHRINVHVSPAKLTKQSAVKVFKYVSQPAKMDCGEIYGFPRPSIRWLKNGENLVLHNRLNITYEKRSISSHHRRSTSTKTESEIAVHSQLMISAVELEDAGFYQCIVENDLGFAASEFQLTVNQTSNHPLPPTGLRYELVDSRTVDLVWDEPPFHIEILGYIVHYSALGTGDTFERQEATHKNLIRIEQLRPYTNYSVYVQAFSSLGDSEPSETITMLTGEERPVEIPFFQLQPLNSSSLLVDWDELTNDEARGRIIKYKIDYKQLDSAIVETIEIGGLLSNFVISHLKPDVSYEVRVIAANSKGFPKKEIIEDVDWISVKMPKQIPRDANVRIMLDLLNEKDVQVQWELYTLNGEKFNFDFQINQVKLTYTKVGSKETFEIPSSSRSKSAIVNDLGSGNYQFDIQVKFKDFDKIVSDSKTIVITKTENDDNLNTIDSNDSFKKVPVDSEHSERIEKNQSESINSEHVPETQFGGSSNTSSDVMDKNNVEVLIPNNVHVEPNPGLLNSINSTDSESLFNDMDKQIENLTTNNKDNLNRTLENSLLEHSGTPNETLILPIFNDTSILGLETTPFTKTSIRDETSFLTNSFLNNETFVSSDLNLTTSEPRLSVYAKNITFTVVDANESIANNSTEPVVSNESSPETNISFVNNSTSTVFLNQTKQLDFNWRDKFHDDHGNDLEETNITTLETKNNFDITKLNEIDETKKDVDSSNGLQNRSDDVKMDRKTVIEEDYFKELDSEDKSLIKKLNSTEPSSNEIDEELIKKFSNFIPSSSSTTAETPIVVKEIGTTGENTSSLATQTDEILPSLLTPVANTEVDTNSKESNILIEQHNNFSQVLFNESKTSQESSRGHEKIDFLKVIYDFEVVVSSSENVLCCWKSDFNLSEIVFYVKYNPDYHRPSIRHFGHVDNDDFLFVRTSDHQVNISNLLPYTMYNFALYFEIAEMTKLDSMGVFDYKKYNDLKYDFGSVERGRERAYRLVKQCRTLESKPGRPQQFTGIALNFQQVQLSWKQPEYPNGEIFAYTIYYSKGENSNRNLSNWAVEEVDGEQYVAIIGNLSANTQYNFVIKARNNAGIGLSSQQLILKTLSKDFDIFEHLWTASSNAFFNRSELRPISYIQTNYKEQLEEILKFLAVGVSCLLGTILGISILHRICLCKVRDVPNKQRKNQQKQQNQNELSQHLLNSNGDPSLPCISFDRADSRETDRLSVIEGQPITSRSEFIDNYQQGSTFNQTGSIVADVHSGPNASVHNLDLQMSNKDYMQIENGHSSASNSTPTNTKTTTSDSCSSSIHTLSNLTPVRSARKFSNNDYDFNNYRSFPHASRRVSLLPDLDHYYELQSSDPRRFNSINSYFERSRQCKSNVMDKSKDFEMHCTAPLLSTVRSSTQGNDKTGRLAMPFFLENNFVRNPNDMRTIHSFEIDQEDEDEIEEEDEDDEEEEEEEADEENVKVVADTENSHQSAFESTRHNALPTLYPSSSEDPVSVHEIDPKSLV